MKAKILGVKYSLDPPDSRKPYAMTLELLDCDPGLANRIIVDYYTENQIRDYVYLIFSGTQVSIRIET